MQTLHRHAPGKARFLEPMLALAVKTLPTGPGWSYELKFDGYRALGLKSQGRARLGSRNGKDFSRRFSDVTRALEALPDETLIDGEIVAVAQDGRPSFRLLQESDASATVILYYAFDLPYLRGQDLRGEPLDSRRRMLQKTVRSLPDSIRFSETFEVPAEQLLQVVRERNLEGVVAKRRDSAYQPGKRSGAWVKLRADHREEFVIGGYVPSGKTFDAILVGRYEEGDFRYSKYSRGLPPSIEASTLRWLFKPRSR